MSQNTWSFQGQRYCQRVESNSKKDKTPYGETAQQMQMMHWSFPLGIGWTWESSWKPTRMQNQTHLTQSVQAVALHLNYMYPQPKQQKKQPASTTTKPQKPDAKVIGCVDGITSQAPPEGCYEFRSITPSPELPAYLQPPTYAPSSSHSPPSPSPPLESQLPRNQLLNTIHQLEKKSTLTERSVIQELTLTKLVLQNERLIHLVQELLDKQPQTASRPPLPLHRPWNVTPSTPTRPPHSVSVPASSTIYFTNNSGNKWQHYTRNSTKSAPSIFSSTRLQPLFVDLDNKFQHIPAQHRISGSTRVAEFNSFAGPGNFAKHLTELLFQSFLLKCLRRFYSYNGDKRNNKNQLDPSRIQPLKEYATHLFPEVTQPQAWKLMVIPKINDALRRPKLYRRHRCN